MRCGGTVYSPAGFLRNGVEDLGTVWATEEGGETTEYEKYQRKEKKKRTRTTEYYQNFILIQKTE